jgi:hypothetical protein
VNADRDFISATGQAYRFEDYIKGLSPTQRPHVSTALKARQDVVTTQRVMALLLRAYEKPEKQSVSVLINQVNFIADTGQLDDCEDYVNNRLDHAPHAIAHFTTRDEAEAWQKGLVEPPSPADILIGDEYYTALYSREDNVRSMYRDYIIEPYVEELAARGISPTTPAFETRAEAEAWLKDHPASPFEFVSSQRTLLFLTVLRLSNMAFLFPQPIQPLKKARELTRRNINVLNNSTKKFINTKHMKRLDTCSRNMCTNISSESQHIGYLCKRRGKFSFISETLQLFLKITLNLTAVLTDRLKCTPNLNGKCVWRDIFNHHSLRINLPDSHGNTRIKVSRLRPY